ncbi:hypothetical protein RB201_16405 [Streptomyces sp. S1A(2023)]
MNRALPQAYWCHADSACTPAAPPPDDLLTTAPGQAVAWMRESVRGLTPALDRDARHRARTWLGDRRTAEAAIRSLRRGQGYAYELPIHGGAWRWTAYPVSASPPVTDRRPTQESRMTDMDTHTETPAPAPAPLSPSAELRAALSEAGLCAGVTDADAGNGVRIAPLDPADARQLARLIRTGTKRALKTARALREICEGYRIDLPGLRVQQGRITLGPVHIDDAARLARLLGAVPPTTASDAGTVAAVLGNAFPQATGGVALSMSVRENGAGDAGAGLGRRPDRATPGPRSPDLNDLSTRGH